MYASGTVAPKFFALPRAQSRSANIIFIITLISTVIPFTQPTCLQLSRTEDVTTADDDIFITLTPKNSNELENTTHYSVSSDYIIGVHTLNNSFGDIVKYTVGILPFKTNNRDIGRLLLLNKVDGIKDSDCASFSCISTCIPRKEVKFLWTSPSYEGARCIEIRTILKTEYDSKMWRKKSIFRCVSPKHGDPPTQHAVRPCCACGHAAYAAYFEGDWRSYYFPSSNNLNKQELTWSELLGVSHDDTYALWEPGGFASAGISELCELSSPGKLENEIKYFGKTSVLTVLKSRDLQAGNRTIQSRSAIFTVNSTHHLVTMLSRFSPSPDWCVGLSLLDMCRPNCSWTERSEHYLYPWDAGTDAGTHFGAPKQKEQIPQRIEYIKSKDRRNESFKHMSYIKPLAKLVIQRIPPYNFDICKI